jgi:hypothetical protein
MYRLPDCQSQNDFFYTVIANVSNKHAPAITTRFKNNDKPWNTVSFKHLITRRNRAWKAGLTDTFKKLRNLVNRTGRSLKYQYYHDRVERLKNDKPHNWWRDVKLLCGITTGDNNCFTNLTEGKMPIDPIMLPELINTFLLSVTDQVPPIDVSALDQIRQNLDSVPDQFIVSELSVFKALKHLKLSKSVCDEFLSNRVLKDLADVLAGPIYSLINSSIRQGVVPRQWKVARISPVPKIYPPVSIETNLRPISVTSSVSKVAESFLCQFFNEHFKSLVDDNQYGCTSNRSTTLASIKLSDLFFKCSDSPHKFIRILFIDFSKAFDLLDHNILMHKFLANDFPLHIIAWSLSFLHERCHYVKVGNATSVCSYSHAGAPQGTRCGPDVFKLLINYLRFELPYVKYVADTTIVSVSDDPTDSSLQSALDELREWCSRNGKIINAKKN